MADLDYLREQARRCRLLAREASDRQAARELEELARCLMMLGRRPRRRSQLGREHRRGLIRRLPRALLFRKTKSSASSSTISRAGLRS